MVWLREATQEEQQFLCVIDLILFLVFEQRCEYTKGVGNVVKVVVDCLKETTSYVQIKMSQDSWWKCVNGLFPLLLTWMGR